MAYVTIDGQRVAPGTAAAYQRMAAAFRAAFGVELRISSGTRLASEQEAIFRERYRVGATSPYGDYRWWNGVRWGRVSGEGTVAVPGTSLHESDRAIDIRDTGSDAGVTTFGTRRRNWIETHAATYGFSTVTGRAVGEAWHLEYTKDPWAGAPATTDGGFTLSSKAEDQIQVIYDAIRSGKKGVRTDGAVTARIRLIEARTAQILEKLAALAGGEDRDMVASQFYKHGEMVTGNLWVFVLPTGDFVRIRDQKTAALYKERNGGVKAQVLSKAAIGALVTDLTGSGGRDLSAIAGSATDTTTTTDAQREQIEADTAQGE